MLSPRRLAALTLLLALGAAACGGGGTPPTASGASTSVGTAGGNLGTPGVIIDANDQLKFDPVTQNVTVGEIVEWKNVGAIAHNIVFKDADAQSLNDPDLAGNGGVWEVKFTKAGTYDYTCTIHLAMDGTIVVGSG